jgi:hypothetical protein
MCAARALQFTKTRAALSAEADKDAAKTNRQQQQADVKTSIFNSIITAIVAFSRQSAHGRNPIHQSDTPINAHPMHACRHEGGNIYATKARHATNCIDSVTSFQCTDVYVVCVCVYVRVCEQMTERLCVSVCKFV